jgi:prenyltransferase beta subunit
MAAAIDSIRGDVRQCLAKSHELLLRTLIVNDRFAGWRQFLRESSLIGTYGTACGLIAYCKLAPEDRDTIQQVASSLAGLHLADGSWDSPTIVPGVGLTTATCYAALALRSSGKSPDSPELQNAAGWLSILIGAEGGVGHAKNDPTPFLICTALTLRTLTALDSARFSREIDLFVTWLCNAQNVDGGFGEKPQTKSSLHHSAEAVIAVSSIAKGSDAVRNAIKRAGRYLHANWNLGQNKHKDVAYITSEEREVMLPHTYQTDGLLMQAELCCVLPTSPRESRFSIAYSHPYMNPMTWR